MIEREADALRAKFENFSRRLRARTTDFQQPGEFSDIHRSLLHRIQQRHDRLAAKLAEAEKSGDKSALVKAEFARDFDGLFDEFLVLEERLDTEAMKMRRK
jgi:hypothetical protein